MSVDKKLKGLQKSIEKESTLYDVPPIKTYDKRKVNQNTLKVLVSTGLISENVYNGLTFLNQDGLFDVEFLRYEQNPVSVRQPVKTYGTISLDIASITISEEDYNKKVRNFY